MKRFLSTLLARCLAVPFLALPVCATDLLVDGGVAGYSTVDAAIADAVAGDRILVGAGMFPGFTLDKAVEVRGAGQGVTRIGSFDTPQRTEIAGIPAGSIAVVTGMSFDPGWFQTLDIGPQIRVSDSAGTVVLQSVHTNVQPMAQQIGEGIVVENTALCVIQNARIEAISSAMFPTSGRDGLFASDSTLDLADVVLQAASDGVGFGEGAAGGYFQRCDVRLVRVEALGGAGGAPGGAGILAEESNLVVAGGPGNELKGGNAVQGGAGLDLRAGSSATLAADVLLTGAIGFPTPGLPLRVDGTSSVINLAIALPGVVLAPAQAPIGGTTTYEATGEAGSACIVAVSPELGAGLQLPGVSGVVYLDLPGTVTVGTIVLSPSGFFGLSLALPANPVLAGTNLWFQQVQVSGAGLDLSNPAQLRVAD